MPRRTVLLTATVGPLLSLLLHSSLLAADAAAAWPMYNGNYSADRFSPLKQITRENVASLKEVARYQLPKITSFQTGPVVVDRSISVTTATSTYAIDGVSGKLLWSHRYTPKSMGLGTPVRGVAYDNGRLYRGMKTWSKDPAKKRAGGGMYSSFALDPAAGALYSC